MSTQEPMNWDTEGLMAFLRKVPLRRTFDLNEFQSTCSHCTTRGKLPNLCDAFLVPDGRDVVTELHKHFKHGIQNIRGSQNATQENQSGKITVLHSERTQNVGCAHLCFGVVLGPKSSNVLTSWYDPACFSGFIMWLCLNLNQKDVCFLS